MARISGNQMMPAGARGARQRRVRPLDVRDQPSSRLLPRSSLPACSVRARRNSCNYIEQRFAASLSRRPHHFERTTPRVAATRSSRLAASVSS